MGGRRKRGDVRSCPRCGMRVEEPSKTWQLISPLPDEYGRLTLTVMASFVCPNCGERWRGVLSKLKVGGGDVEIETGKGSMAFRRGERPPVREGEVIELDLEDILK